MPVLDDLKPKRRLLVMNLLEEAGVDVSPWYKIKGAASKAASNPKYCYNWSFEQPGEVIVVCLWHAGIKSDGPDIVYRASGVDAHRARLRFLEQARR
jgi:hypothetical protein